jgi:hypothetical protein
MPESNNASPKATPLFTIARKVRLGLAIALAIGSLAIFMLSSMAGPHQLDYLGVTLVCDIGLVILAAI